MKKPITCFMLIIATFIYSQEKTYTDQELKVKLDSVTAEGNLLYSLENASWHSNDIARAKKEIRSLIGHYLTYQSNDSVKTVFLNNLGNQVIAEYSFVKNAKSPSTEKLRMRPLNKIETDLITIRQKLIEQFADPQYQVSAPEGFNLNIITIPFGEKYKTYLIPGTSDSSIIPFGNDYLFITDAQGNISKHQKIHSRLIPTMTNLGEGKTITMSTHSHLIDNPFISATDICTFKLYAHFSKLTKFSVYSKALGSYLEYDLVENKISKVDQL